MGKLTLGTNIAALRARRQLDLSASSASKAFERLSSGMRINSSADDPAGISLSAKMRNDARVYSQGLRNINDGISALNIADGTVTQLSSILIRLKELATQSSSGSVGLRQRTTIDSEARALTDEFNRLLAGTKFNRRAIIDGTAATLGIQLGYGTNGQITVNMGGQLARTRGTGAMQAAVGSTGLVTSMDSSALADVNGDGKDDLVYLDSGRVRYRLSNGDGTYQGIEQIDDLGTTMGGLTVADVNNDGHSDIVVAADDAKLHVYHGQGGGSFTAVAAPDLGSPSINAAPAVGDLNGDGYLDIVVAGASKISIMLNDGAGGFLSASEEYTIAGAGTSITSIALGDINGDSRLDIAVTSQGTSSINTFLGNGNGTFQSKISNSSSGADLAGGLVIADLNHDGIGDVAASDYNGSIRLRLGNTSGTLGTETTYAAIDRTIGLLAGDFNGDGYMDLATGGTTLADSVGIHLNNGNGTLATVAAYDTVSSSTGTIAAGDINGDGVLDIVAGTTGSGDVSTYRGATTTTNNIQRLNLTTQSEARDALDLIEAIMERVAREQGRIGGDVSRLQSARNVLQGLRENYLAANSRIADADIAQESAKLISSQIRQQVATSVLAQANLMTQLVLNLLKAN